MWDKLHYIQSWSGIIYFIYDFSSNTNNEVISLTFVIYKGQR